MLVAFCLSAAVAYADGTECNRIAVLAPCEYEDSSSCYWQASVRGNGKGQSFVDVNGEFYVWDGSIEWDEE